MHTAESCAFEVTIDQQMVDQFAAFSGDHNPIHIDAAAGQASEFKGRIAHGALLLSYVSRFLGMEIPGPGCVITGMDVRFPKPFRPPEKAIVKGALKTYNPERQDGRVEVIIESAQGTHVQAGVHFMKHGQASAVEPSRETSLKKSTLPRSAKGSLLITGGTGGMGSDILDVLAQHYFCVTLSRKKQSARTQVQNLEVDIETHQDLESILSQLNPNDFYGIVHMSAPKPSAARLTQPHADWQQQLYHAVSLPIRLAQWAQTPGSTIRRLVLMGSTAGTKHPELSMPSYSLAKSAVSSLLPLLAVDLASIGATVNCVSPGFVPVGMNAGVPQRKQSSLAGLTPTGRLTQPKDVAQTISFLLSDAAEQINGTTLTIDGGYFGL